MNHLKLFENYINPIDWITKHNRERASYKLVNGKLNVIGNVNISNYELKEIPVSFGAISGIFYCYNNKLTSLKGAPLECETFYCYNNELTSLKGAPLECENFYCYNNKLTSLEGAPLECKDFYCNNNLLTNLEYIPEKVTKYFDFKNNKFDEKLQKRLDSCKTWEEVLTLSYINKSDTLTKLNDTTGIFENI